MVLVFTSSEDATADYLCERLSDENVAHLRLDTDRLVSNTTAGYAGGSSFIRVDGTVYRPGDVSNIWYRRPEALRDPRFDGSPEGKFSLSEWSEALEGFFAHVPSDRWMNHPSANFAASHKLEQLSTARSLGFQVPDTLVTQDEGELQAFFELCDGRLIAKPLSTGYVDRSPVGTDSLIYTNQVVRDDLNDVDCLRSCPTLFQRYIDKDADYRITVVDHDIHAARLIAKDPDGSQRCDVRRNNMADVVNISERLPAKIEELVLRLVSRYGLRFGAIDMATTLQGEWVFFEINPNGQWAWLDIASGFDIASSFARSFSGRRS